MSSETTGLRLVPEGKRLRLRDAATDAPLPWQEEDVEARAAAEREVERQTRRAEAAEQRIRALEEELTRLRGDDPERRPQTVSPIYPIGR